MSARLALRPAVTRIDPERPGRWSSPAPSSFLRSFAGDAPIQLVGPMSGIVVVVAFSVAYVIALASAGAEAVGLLGAPTFAAAVLLSGRLATLAWGLTVAATIALLGPSEVVASEADASYQAVVAVVSAVALRAIVVLAVTSRTDELNDEAASRDSALPSWACSRRRRAG